MNNRPMDEGKKLAIGFTQMLLRAMAADLAAQKELVGPDSVLASKSSRDAAELLKGIADGLEFASRINGNDDLIVLARWSPQTAACLCLDGSVRDECVKLGRCETTLGAPVSPNLSKVTR